MQIASSTSLLLYRDTKWRAMYGSIYSLRQACRKCPSRTDSNNVVDSVYRKCLSVPNQYMDDMKQRESMCRGYSQYIAISNECTRAAQPTGMRRTTSETRGYVSLKGPAKEKRETACNSPGNDKWKLST